MAGAGARDGGGGGMTLAGMTGRGGGGACCMPCGKPRGSGAPRGKYIAPRGGGLNSPCGCVGGAPGGGGGTIPPGGTPTPRGPPRPRPRGGPPGAMGLGSMPTWGTGAL